MLIFDACQPEAREHILVRDILIFDACQPEGQCAFRHTFSNVLIYSDFICAGTRVQTFERGQRAFFFQAHVLKRPLFSDLTYYMY